MENYQVVLKVKLKKSKHLSETSTMSLTVKCLVRIGSVVVTFCHNRCEIDLSGNYNCKIHTPNLFSA